MGYLASRIVFLHLLLLAAVYQVHCQCNVLTNGGYIKRSLTVSETPCDVHRTVIIAKDTTLTVNAGVTLRFAPGVMLAINGTLLAKGTPTERIVMTKLSGSAEDPPPIWPADIRLVDESSVMFGRLQIQYRQKWRGICANFQNWTQTDVDVACRHLGFRTGNFSFLSWARNDSSFMLYQRPSCTGAEKDILECPGNVGIQIGSRICVHQQTIHLRCYGLAPDSPAKDYWWGLELYNASRSVKVDGNVVVNESSTILQNVDIMYAGVAPDGTPVPAIRASPSVPSLVNVTIKNVALDATNFTEVLTSTIVYNSTVSNCRGNGLVVESYLGRVEVRNSRFLRNYGNGVKAKFLDGSFVVIDDTLTFCKMSSIGAQTFPQMISGIPALGGSCGRRFETQFGQRVTLNVIEMDIEPGTTGKLEVFDGRDTYSPLLITFDIMNRTLPMGITSTFYYMFVKFSWNIPPGFSAPGRGCVTLRDCVKFTIVVDTAPESKAEFYMNSSVATDNLQHGLFVENIRNYIVVNASSITHNGYGAGIRVYSGAGDILINASVVDYNQDNGVNITYQGGWRIFNMSSFSYNRGNGINITMNETRTLENGTVRYSRHQRTEVSRSSFTFNDGHGVRVGNHCQAASAIVNDSSFVANQRIAVEFESCYLIIPDANVTNFTIGYNWFEANRGHAIRIVPLLNAVGRIANNTFLNHSQYVLMLDNGENLLDERFFQPSLVQYEIAGNRFENNRGVYVVNLRLTQGSQRQKLDFRYNVLKNNEISGATATLNERTRAYAVIIISSGNIYLMRNHLENWQSQYEIATHLRDMSVTLQAMNQWWGTTDYEKIVPRIFDQFNRYDLAHIVYHPALAYDWLYTPVFTDRNNALEVAFSRGNYLGGRLGVDFYTTPGMTYEVDRDISVLGLGRLFVTAGTTLEFGNALGLLVEGYVEFNGQPDRPVTLRLRNESTWINHTLVRLVDGPSLLEGRLEVRPTEEDKWGTVCSDGWTIEDASVACQMMGFIVGVDSWKTFKTLPGTANQPIWRSNVRCINLDMDLMTCEADDENDHSCTHARDVYVKCVDPTWAGVRFLTSANPSRLRYVNISGAGLMDPAAITYSPALRIDYNVHTLEHITVVNNMADGVLIMHNDVYAGAKLASSNISENGGNGVTIHGSFFEVYDCYLANNRRAGFEYSPAYTASEALQIRAGIRNALVFDRSMQYRMERENRLFVTTPRRFSHETVTYDLEVVVTDMHKVVLDLLDFNPEIRTEKITVYDSRLSAIVPSTQHWSIDEDLVDFPVVSQLTYLTIRWTITGVSSGRFAFVLRSKPWEWRWPFATLVLRNSTVTGNADGIVTRHYNQPSNEWLDLFHRFRWETVRMYGLELRQNLYEAVHVLSITRYHALYLPTYEELQRSLRIAEISYIVESCHFEGNGGGVLAEHNHVEFSNNVWIWQVSSNRFERNVGGGFMIELPKVNLMYTELYNHSVAINDSLFIDNVNFAFRIDGFYCNSTIARNRFQGNLCRVGCVTIAGTEKDLELHDNEFVENTGRYIVEFNMNSHTPFTQWVESRVQYNIIKRNSRPADVAGKTATSQPTTYGLGIRGVQNVTINRNLFSNPNLDFEMLGGQSSSMLENYLDVTENWWGTVDQLEIMNRIFDFDDWNSFAIVEYCPFLVADSFRAAAPKCVKVKPVLDLSRPFGGRLTENLRLPRRTEPYVIKSDMTVMSHVSLTIEAGAELQFYPSVGMLVLGSLVISGNDMDRVKFGPIPRTQYVTNRGRRSAVPVQSIDRIHHPDINAAQGYEVRFVGGANEDEGFIQIYNQTERRWEIICDNNFNDRTAEVACRTAGRESSNVIVRTSPYYDIFVLGFPKMHEQVIEWFWRETLICDGRESSLDQCRYKINYNLHQCMDERNYVYVRCGPRNLPPEYEYWGNIRISFPDYELADFTAGYSSLSNLDIYGAGYLHEDKVAAVQFIYRVANSRSVRVHHCASHGYDYVAPRDQFLLEYGAVENNNGYAVGALILNGESSEQPESQFMPLVINTAPYNTYGLLRMCTVQKLVYVRDRALLYHKYTFDTIDCIKVIRSREPHKQIAVRFLQVHIYNDSFYRNAIEMYNGEFFDPRQLIGDLTVNSTHRERRLRYSTSVHYDTMGIRVTGSPAYGDYGFIVEIVTLPQSPSGRPDFGPGKQQRIARMSMTKNEGGGFVFRNVGDNNPRVTFESNSLHHCGVAALNITSPSMVDIFIQNSRMLTIANNYIAYNAGGGILVNTTTKDNEVAIYANVTNNLVIYNTHGEPVHFEGHQYQGFDVRYNYIAYNDIDHRNVIAAFGIQLNFTTNIVFHNKAQCIVNASVLEKISINQRYVRNAIYDNIAFAYNRSTVFLKSAKFEFRDNFLVNPYNVYEMVTFNRTKYPDGTYPSVEARNNWWGRNHISYVAGRIWERRDDDNLIRVEYEPFLTTNKTVLSGKCFPGWREFDNKCYWYFGGVVLYSEAESMCKAIRGRLAWARDPKGRERNLGELVSQFQYNYDVYWRVWVYSDRMRDETLCTVLRDYRVEQANCTLLLPFVCERDPYIQTTMDWLPIIIICSIVGSLLVFVILPLMLFACFKSRQRRVEKVERRENLAQSLRASRESLASTRGAAASRALRASRESLDALKNTTIDAKSTTFDDLPQKRRRPPIGPYDPSSSAFDDSNNDSVEKPSKYDYYQPRTPLSSVDFASTKWDGESAYNDSEFDTPMPHCENEIATASVSGRPQFDYGYRRPDDDASVTQSLMGYNPSGGSRRPARPRPAFVPEVSGLGTVDETESVRSRPTSDASSTAEPRNRPPRPRIR